MVISCLYVKTVTRQCFCFPNSQWGVTAHDNKDDSDWDDDTHVPVSRSLYTYYS